MIVLLQPPFFRCAGSHNDRVLLELCYASRFLEDAGIEHVVVNADYLGSTVYHPWRLLFENQDHFIAACDGRSPLIDEAVGEGDIWKIEDWPVNILDRALFVRTPRWLWWLSLVVTLAIDLAAMWLGRDRMTKFRLVVIQKGGEDGVAIKATVKEATVG